MALHPPSSSEQEKLIFAPSPVAPASAASEGVGSSAVAGAGQFTKHEQRGGLRRADLDAHSPILQFHAWFDEARAAGIAHPETCTLSTASLPSGRVSARMVYLKELDRQGFVLYSNFGTSQKAADLFGSSSSSGSGSGGGSGRPGEPASVGNRWAALTFWWSSLERQVRVEGRAARLSAAESQVYFDTRVRGSRIGAWASRQSQVLVPAKNGGDDDDDGRAQLERWVAEAAAKFGGQGTDEGEGDDAGEKHIPVPEFWGGLRIVPERIEFWQGRQNRLHDRFVYTRQHKDGPEAEATADDVWTLDRLSP